MICEHCKFLHVVLLLPIAGTHKFKPNIVQALGLGCLVGVRVREFNSSSRYKIDKKVKSVSAN